jgi:hypothetical protein
MPAYGKLIDQITARTETVFRPASEDDLAALRTLRLPRPVIEFFARYEPSDCAEGQVRLWPIANVLEENSDFVPGAYICALGYIVFATTFCGDVYCFDLNKVDKKGEPPIVLISHEAVDEDITTEEVGGLAKHVAKNLFEFLEKFARDDLDEDCIY